MTDFLLFLEALALFLFVGAVATVVVEGGFHAIIVGISTAWRWCLSCLRAVTNVVANGSTEKLLVMLLVTMLVGFTSVILAEGVRSPMCADEGAPAHATYSPQMYWVVDKFGVGHRIEESIGSHSLLILRRVAPSSEGLELPHVAQTMVEADTGCSWKVAEVFSDQDQDWLAYGTRFNRAGTLTFRRLFGLIRGTVPTDGATGYAMDAERWSGLHGSSDAACVACFHNGVRYTCPSVEISSDSSKETIKDCNLPGSAS